MKSTNIQLITLIKNRLCELKLIFLKRYIVVIDFICVISCVNTLIDVVL